jgi:hypothetical protein
LYYIIITRAAIIVRVQSSVIGIPGTPRETIHTDTLARTWTTTTIVLLLLLSLLLLYSIASRYIVIIIV